MPTDRVLKVVGDNDDRDLFDPFALDDRGYSRDNFYTKSTDGKGNSETKYMKLPPSFIARIGELVASRKVPAYRTDADFIRDAILHRLHDVSQMVKNGELESFVNRQVMLSRVASRREEMSEFNALVTTHEEAMTECVQTGDRPLLGELLNDAEHDLLNVRPAYQRRLRILVKRFRDEWNKMARDDEEGKH